MSKFEINMQYEIARMEMALDTLARGQSKERRAFLHRVLRDAINSIHRICERRQEVLDRNKHE